MALSTGLAARLRTRLAPFVPRTPATIAWLAVTLVETAVDTVIVALTLNTYAEKLWRTVLERDERSVLPVYLGLVRPSLSLSQYSFRSPADALSPRPQFVLAHLTQLVLAVDALVAKNTIQVVALAILNGLLAVYAGIQIADIRSLVSGYLAILIWCIPACVHLSLRLSTRTRRLMHLGLRAQDDHAHADRVPCVSVAHLARVRLGGLQDDRGRPSRQEELRLVPGLHLRPQVRWVARSLASSRSRPRRPQIGS